ncbi:ankyrin repeat protein [Xylogone sp. PMI_703]|nr:ankyrin repeat protein [Xylogone sp. PMI_703]
MSLGRALVERFKRRSSKLLSNDHNDVPSTIADDAPIPPKPSSQFLSHLSNNPRTSARELLQPYLAYETWLRKAFARGDAGIEGLANLVPVYDGHENSFKIRTIDRETADSEKYLMPLSDDELETGGAPAITTSLEEYQRNFEAFTHGVLAGLDWSNIVVAGSSALLPLLSRRKEVNIKDDLNVENPLETYFQTIASASDIDIFIYGLDSEDAAIKRILELEAAVRKNQRLLPGAGLTLRSENAITFISPKWPYRHVQVILRLYKSISEILTGFDVDCACVAYDGRQVYSNPRGIAAIATRTNTIDLSRRSPSYENRLWKYRNQNFDVFWDGLDRSQIDEEYFRRFVEDFGDLKSLQGLARLIFSEAILARDYNPYWRKRHLKKFDDGGEPTFTPESGYASHDVPYAERFTAERVRKYVARHSKEPHLFGTIQEVVVQGMKPGKKGKEKLAGKIDFLKDDPGRQMIGSFHPLTEDDWTEMAYSAGKEDNEEGE